MKIQPFVSDDYKEALEGGWCIDDPSHIGEMFAVKGPAFTARAPSDPPDRGVIIACAGVFIFYPGFGEAWVVLSHFAEMYPFVYRHIHIGLRKIIKHYKLRRVQASVKADFRKGVKMVEHLGFQLESEMPLFGPNSETFNRYVMFPRVPARLSPAENLVRVHV